MALISRILVPVVFSERCQDATRYAAALACRFHCELTLLNVFIQPWAAYSSPEGYATPPPYDLESTLAQVKEQFDGFLADELRTLSVRRVLSEGDPASVIARYACSESCDLIVMPTHGYGPFRRFLLGSVTAKVLHDVSCPVFTGPHLEHPPALESPRFQKILCALDLCPESRAVVEWASRFAGEFGSEIAMVYAIPASTDRLAGMYFDPQWRIDLAARARQEMSFLQAEVKVKGEILIEIGDVPGAVRAAAEATRADLVVVGRGRAHGMIGRLRANTYGIVRESCCPVVAV
ncbi:MAG TPA: universal stress protein [Bryobacteraceae bacterium]|jgi:nucleotide-binding universal stress UspA family protein|nr:universal stress protein [Bryobacteraceae bacterium]